MEREDFYGSLRDHLRTLARIIDKLQTSYLK